MDRRRLYRGGLDLSRPGGLLDRRLSRTVRAPCGVGPDFSGGPGDVNLGGPPVARWSADGFIAGFLYYTARRSWASAFAVAVAAGLTRETGLLLVAGLVGSALFARQYRRAVGFATAALPTFGWYAFTAWHVRSPEIPLLLEWPLLGQVRRLFVFREFAVPAWKQLVFQMVDLAAVLGLLASLAIAAWFVWKREVGPVELVAGFYVALGLVLGETGYMTEAYAFARPISPVLLYVMVTAVRRRLWWCLAAPLR